MDEDNLKPLTGSRVISTLAEVYKQLYLCPGREGQAQYDDVVKRGRDVKKKSLSHFCMDERDRLEYLDTPAGSVQCVTLHKRSDFVTFLQIMANRCEAVDIPDTQGRPDRRRDQPGKNKGAQGGVFQSRSGKGKP